MIAEISNLEAVIGGLILVVVGGVIEYRYGSKINPTITADLTALKADVAELKAKAVADLAKVKAAV